MEIALDTAARLPGDDHEANDQATTITRDPRAAERFLKEFANYKLVIIVDTHCAESGFFLWKGKIDGEFETSPLLPVSIIHHRPPPHLTSPQILQDCIPAEIFKFLDASDTTPYPHKALIVNLSCGPSIEKEESRHSLLQG